MKVISHFRSVWMAILLMFGAHTAAAASSLNEPALYQTDLVIDAGHGGVDGGAVYGSLLEKDVNLAISKRLYAELNRKSISVALNRDRDYAPSDDNRWLRNPSRHKRDLAQRTHMANALHPKLLVSIHVNTSTSSRKSGPLVLHQKNPQSKQAATIIQQALNREYGVTERPVTGRTFYLLNHATCPAIIVELGYLTNDADRKRLTSPKQQQKLARVLASAIEQYLNLNKPSATTIMSKHKG